MLRQQAADVLTFVKNSTTCATNTRRISIRRPFQLLELARTMMPDARLILLDEPGARFTPTSPRYLVRNIQHLQQTGRMLLLIEHDIDLVMEICNPVIVMSNGSMLMEGTPTQVRHDPRVIEVYLGESAMALLECVR